MNRTELTNLKIGDVLEMTLDVEAFSSFRKLKPGARYGRPRAIVHIEPYGGVDGDGCSSWVIGRLDNGNGATESFSIIEGEVCYRVVK
jgi:hypothetical protein